MQFEVENVKCGGCADIIIKKLGELDAVGEVSVDVASGTVTVDSGDVSAEFTQRLVEALGEAGYPVRSST